MEPKIGQRVIIEGAGYKGTVVYGPFSVQVGSIKREGLYIVNLDERVWTEDKKSAISLYVTHWNYIKPTIN